MKPEWLVIAIISMMVVLGTVFSGCLTFLPSVEAEYCCGTSPSIPEAERGVVGLVNLQSAVADPSHPVSRVWIDRMTDREEMGVRSNLSPNAHEVKGRVAVLSPGEYVVVIESSLGERTLEVVDTGGRTTTITVPARVEAALTVEGAHYYNVDSDGQTLTISDAGGVRDLVGPRHRIKF